LQVINYIFLKNKYLLLFLVIILVAGASCSCTPDTLWNIPIETIRQKLYNSDYSFLHNINFNEEKASDARVLGPGALYYFSTIFSHTGYPDRAKELISLSWQQEKKYWKNEGGILLLSTLLEEKKYELLEHYALKHLRQYRKSENSKTAKKMYIEALYWQKKDKAVLDAIQEFFPPGKSFPKGKFLPGKKKEEEKDPEIILFQAVSGCRLQQKGWENTFIRLFFEFESSSIHDRAFQFIMLDKQRTDAFKIEMQHLMLAKSLHATGTTDSALTLMENFLKQEPPGTLKDALLIRELGYMYLGSGDYQRGSRFLASLAEKYTGSLQMDALEMAGRIARKNNDDRNGARYLERVVQDTRDLEQKDRAAWFYLDCVLSFSPEQFVEKLISYALQWQDPVYFEDIIEKSISIFIGKKKWHTIFHLYTSLRHLASEKTAIHLEFLAARLFMNGYITEENITTRGKNLQEEITGLLKKVSNRHDTNYYSFFAALLLDQEPLYTKNHKQKSDDQPAGDDGKKKSLTSLEKFITGFFNYGLIEDGYSMAFKYRESISNPVLLSVVKRLKESGYVKESIWLMNTYTYRKDYQLTKQEMMYAYPRAYQSVIDEQTESRNFFPPFFYALVREESAFDPGNSSTAGAVGLSQLMPLTAEDIAGWLRLDDYDLTDPETNILMGAYYFSRLLRVLDNIPKTLIAYNAGLGNLRRWEKEFKGLPIDLFIEAVPFRETRGYVKKIITTTCIYSSLYYDIPASGVFPLIFKDMF
jgi:soluble lytic murein transglycosylase